MYLISFTLRGIGNAVACCSKARDRIPLIALLICSWNMHGKWRQVILLCKVWGGTAGQFFLPSLMPLPCKLHWYLWSTATGRCLLGNFSSITVQVVVNWPHEVCSRFSTASSWPRKTIRYFFLYYFILNILKGIGILAVIRTCYGHAFRLYV